MSSAWAMIDNVWRLGTLRPLSTKLICFCDTPVSRDKSNWLLPRRSRQWRNNAPTSFADLVFRFCDFIRFDLLELCQARFLSYGSATVILGIDRAPQATLAAWTSCLPRRLFHPGVAH